MWDYEWQEHLDAVHRFAVRLTGDRQAAEDVAQEALLRGWKSRGKLADARRVRIWLLRIATNVWRDRLRQQRSRPAGVALDFEPAAAGDDFERHEEYRHVLRAMDQLPERQRRSLHLVAIEGLSNQEAAEVLGTTADAVKANVWHARKALKAWLATAVKMGDGVR